MPDKDELDRYAIPNKLRVKIFQWGLSGLGATASILLGMLLNCQNARRTDTERFLNRQIELAQEKADQRADEKIRQASNQISPQINDVAQDIDSLKKQIKALKN